jgi:hypothetical protein
MRSEGYSVFSSGSPNHPGDIVVPIQIPRISAITLEHRKLDLGSLPATAESVVELNQREPFVELLAQD